MTDTIAAVSRSPEERVAEAKARREQNRRRIEETRETAEILIKEREAEERERARANRSQLLTDLGRNTLDLPESAFRGAARGIAQLPAAIADAGDALEKFVTGEVKDRGPNILRQTTEAVTGAIEDTIPEPRTVTGSLSQGVGQFLSGFVGGKRLLQGAKLLQGTSRTSQLANAAASGAIADLTAFDPHEERLSNLLDDHPSLSNPVTDYLRADPEDTAAEGRLKNAVEGLGLGLAVDAFVKTLRAMRIARQVKAAQAADKARQVDREIPVETDEATQEAPKDRPSNPQEAGSADAEAPSVDTGEPREGLAAKEITKGSLQAKLRIDPKAAAEVARRVAQGDLSSADELIDFNSEVIAWETFGEHAGEIRQLINTTSEVFSDLITETKGGVQPIREAARLADLVGAKPSEVSRLFADVRGGAGLTARVMAAERTLLASASRLKTLAKAVVEDGSNQARVDLLRHIELHAGIQAQVKGAKTEVARSLRVMRELKRASEIDFEAFEEAARLIGRDPASQELAKKLAEAGGLREINKLTRKTRYQRYRDVALEIRINSLLSSPKTHIINAASNTVKSFEAIVERFLASGIGAARRAVGQQTETIAVREAVEVAFGTLRGLSDALRIPTGFGEAVKQSLSEWSPDAVRAFLKENAEQFGSTYQAAVEGKPIVDQRSRIEIDTRKALQFETQGRTGLARMAAQAGNAIGQAVRVPGAALTVSDDFFKSIAYRQQVNALAYRKASNLADERNLRGSERAAFVTDEIAKTLDELPEDIHLAAIDFAQYQTFTSPLGDVGRAIEGFLARVPEARLILPFLRTPTNIIKQVAERTPLPLLKLIQQDFRRQLAQGGPEADLMLSRMALGTAAIYGAWELVSAGLITGGGIPGRDSTELSGVKPYSMKVGETWFQMNRLEPIGMLVGTVADFYEIVQRSFDPDGDNTELLDAARVVMLATAKNVTSKTYLKGVSDFFSAMANPEQFGDSFLKNFGTSLVPFSGALRAAAQANDPVAREAFTFLEALKRNLPGLSDDLAPRRDYLGRVVEPGTQWWNPIAVSNESDDVLDHELARLAFKLNMPARAIEGVGLTASQYSRLLELRGQHAFSGKALEATLRDFIASDDYRNLPEDPDPSILGTKQDAVKRIVGKFQKAAKEALLEEDAELRQRVEGERERRRGNLSQSQGNTQAVIFVSTVSGIQSPAGQ